MARELEMTSEALVELLDCFDAAGIAVWLDGGWGVDALLKEQTRKHKDVDVIPQVSDVLLLREVLSKRGFSFKEGKPPDSLVLADGEGLEVDVHAVRFDEAGSGVYRMQDGGDWIFPAESFEGRGRVDGRGVRCLSPKAQVLCHAQGYLPVEKDLCDMERLHERFGVDLPPHLQRRADA